MLALDISTGKHADTTSITERVLVSGRSLNPLLIDVTRDGRTFPAPVHPGRNGYPWILERDSDGISFVDAIEHVYQDVFTAIDPTQDVRATIQHVLTTGQITDFCPSLWGGKDWPAPAYNPGTRLLYIPANNNHCGTI